MPFHSSRSHVRFVVLVWLGLAFFGLALSPSSAVGDHDLVFQDDFEDGTTNAWSETVGGIGGDITINLPGGETMDLVTSRRGRSTWGRRRTSEGGSTTRRTCTR